MQDRTYKINWTTKDREDFNECFIGHPTNCFPTNWLFFETDVRIRDIPKDKELKEYLDGVWEDWCKEHKRKFSSIFKEGDEQ